MQKIDKKKITELMQDLSEGRANRSATAQIRDIYEDIEIALSKGVKRLAIWEELKNFGYEIELKSFETALFRIRKERGEQKPRKSVTPVSTGSTGLPAAPVSQNRDDKNLDDSVEQTQVGVPQRPPGITNATWSQMQQKHKAEQRLLKNTNEIGE